jgi:signal transduction histidine kinase
MNHVPRSWLRRFQLVLLFLDVLVLGVYVYQTFMSRAMPVANTAVAGVHQHGTATGMQLGINATIAFLAALHAVWCLGAVWWMDKARPWLAHATGIMLFGIMLVLLVNQDSSIHAVYHYMLIIFVFLAAMCGPAVVMAVLSLGFIMLITTSLSGDALAHDPITHVREMILLMLAAASGGAGWYVFKRKYVRKAGTQEVAALNSLIKQEQTTVGLVLESITDGVMILTPEGTVQVLNTSCAKLLGWPKDEAYNLQVESLIEPTSTTEKGIGPQAKTEPTTPETMAITDTIHSGLAAHKVSLIKTREGRQIYIDIAASPIFQDGPQAGNKGQVKPLVGIIAVLRDVDKQKREEAQRSEFISTASHEMRTPVAAIEGYLALAMNQKVSSIDAKARTYLEKAYSSTQHLGRLFQDLLTSARVEDGRLVSHPQPVEVGQFMEQLVDSLRFAAEKKGLKVELTIGASTATGSGATITQKVIKPFYYVLVDPERMQEVITNLFDNAVKYSESGKISVGLTGNEEVVQMFIKDNGVGIPAEDVPHLFQKFYRVDNSDTRTIGGTGLGLFICRKIIELYQGKVWVESELHKGSTFYINLPRLDTQKAEELKAAAAGAPLAAPASNATAP